jgi:hypothetical protein
MADSERARQDEIDRVLAAANDLAKLMRCRFVPDEAKLQAFAPKPPREPSTVKPAREIHPD